MKGFYENLKKLSLGDFVAVASLISDWIFQGVFEKELPRVVFVGILMFLIYWIIKRLIVLFSKMRKQKEDFEARRIKMLDSYKGKGGDTWLEAMKKDEKAKKRFRVRRKKLIIVTGMRIAFCFILGIFLCVKNPNNAWALYQMLTEQSQPTNEPESQPTNQPANESENEPVQETNLPEESEPTEAATAPAGATIAPTEAAAAPATVSETQKEKGRIPKPLEFRFVLIEPERKPDIDKEVETYVFFMDRETDQSLEEYIDMVMKEIGGCRFKGVNLLALQDKDGNTFNTYTAAEDQFKKEVLQFQEEKYLDVWREKAPKSTVLDSFMSGREELSHIAMDGEEGHWEIWWKLANDNQYYALEYERQTQNGEAVLYYYVSSIYCSLEALKYEMPEEKRDQIYHYAVMRYKDINEMKLEIPLLYKELSRQIYDHLLENDKLRDEGEGGTAFETDVTVR